MMKSYEKSLTKVQSNPLIDFSEQVKISSKFHPLYPLSFLSFPFLIFALFPFSYFQLPERRNIFSDGKEKPFYFDQNLMKIASFSVSFIQMPTNKSRRSFCQETANLSIVEQQPRNYYFPINVQ